MKIVLDALNTVIQNEAAGIMSNTPGKKNAKLPWATGDMQVMGGLDGGMDGKQHAMLLECISKQESILGAVAKQASQQGLLNRITVLTQAVSGYQQEISSLRNTLSATENRIHEVEIKIAEIPGAEQRLSMVIAKQQEVKNDLEIKIKELQHVIIENRKKIEDYSNEIDDVNVLGDSSQSRKRKFDEVPQSVDEMPVSTV